jgi:signal peptidase I
MRWQSILISTLSAAVIAGVAVPLRPTVVLGHSMTPTLRPGGCYVLNTRYYRHHSLQCGDIVVFRHQGETLTKRIYALPGQHLLLIRYDDGVGNEIVEPWQAPSLRRLERAHRLPDRRLEDVTVPPGHCFVVGDNRPLSCDSRTFGCIPESEILGRVFL